MGRGFTRQINAAIVCYRRTRGRTGMSSQQYAVLNFPVDETIKVFVTINVTLPGRSSVGTVLVFGLAARSTSTRRCQLSPKGLHCHVYALPCLKILLLLQSMPYIIIFRSHYSSPAEKRRPSSRASKIYSKPSIRGTERSNFNAKSERGCLTICFQL